MMISSSRVGGEREERAKGKGYEGDWTAMHSDPAPQGEPRSIDDLVGRSAAPFEIYLPKTIETQCPKFGVE